MEQLSNEFYIVAEDDSEEKIVTDEVFKLAGSLFYHLEIQSTKDKSMLIRMYKYDTQIALKNSVLEENVLTVSFPLSAVMYLRSTKSTPDESTVRLITPGDMIEYSTPNLKVKDYTVDELFEKRLLLLIPFHIFVYENKLGALEKDSEKRRRVVEEFAGIRECLNRLAEEGSISEYEGHAILAMAGKAQCISETLHCETHTTSASDPYPVRF